MVWVVRPWLPRGAEGAPSHSWQYPRPGWMGARCCAHGKGVDWMVLKVPPNPNILGFYILHFPAFVKRAYWTLAKVCSRGFQLQICGTISILLSYNLFYFAGSEVGIFMAGTS